MSPVFPILLSLCGVLAEPVAAAPDVRPVDLIVAAEDAPWMMPVATPLAGRFCRQGRPALLVAAEFPPKPRANWLITRAPDRVVALSTAESVRLGPVLPTFLPEVVTLGVDPVYGSFAVAKRFWGQTRRVVAVADDDMEAILCGAVWAERRGARLLLRERSGSKAALQADLRDLAVADVVVAVGDSQRAPPWAALDGFHCEVLPVQTIQERLVAQLGPENIRTLILARVPDASLNVGASAWLAPYLCAVRGAPLILCRGKTATAAEAAVDEFIRRYRPHPRTLTILAGYASIGCELMEIGAEAEKTSGGKPNGGGATPVAGDAPAEAHAKYTVEREPCVPTDFYRAAPLGVGRIPLDSLGEASLMFARGLVRERLPSSGPGRVLLVANSSADRKPLPLGEVISRVTGQEFKNFGIPLDEFYGRLADSPEVLAAAKQASLIIYEGHTAYQDLIYVPYPHVYLPDEYYEEALGALENRTPDAPSPSPENAAPPAPHPPAPRKPLRLEGPLAEIPIVVLQGCDSLDDEMLERIDELGCAAVIGSVTPIHSGSGSMLIHAFANGLLRPGNTLGESLRDAQNFLFCLEELKVERGLKEFAKTQRVALSFRLWGDPELPVFAKLGSRPLEKLLEAHWSGPEELTIEVPAKRFAKVGNGRYSAHVFPGSQAVGLVKKQKGSEVRRVLCAYYFRLPMPEHFHPEGKVLQSSGGAANQATYRVDPLGRFVLVTYLPDVEKAHETIVLRWMHSAAGR